MKVKKMVNGAEVEVEQKEDGSFEYPGSSPSDVIEDVIPPETPEDPEPPKKDDVDEQGVPWKNRALEYQRKYQDAIGRNSAPAAPAQPEPEDEWTKQQRNIARNEITKERNADKQMNRILNGLEEANPYIKTYRNQIEDELSVLSPELRSNEYTVEHVASAYIGKNIDTILKSKNTDAARKADAAEKNKKLLGGSDVLQPHSPAPEGKVVLTAEEESFASERNLFDKGFSTAEIREMYKKRKEKLEKKK